MKTAIGIVTFGNHQFTRLGLRELQLQGANMLDVILIVGKPGDEETFRLAEVFGVGMCIRHSVNKGFPGSVNDLYDICFQAEHGRQSSEHRYDNLILMGNDVVPYPGAIEALTRLADHSAYDVVCSCMFDTKALLARYPAAAQFFKGNNLEFTDFEARPWDLHGPENIPPCAVVEGNRGGLQDLTLFKRSVFEKIGYTDVNFYPAYYNDNDYWRRMMLAGVRVCSVTTSCYFHFWSRTIHQGGETAHTGGAHFRLNEEFYRRKWGGRVGAETFALPFEPSAAAQLDAAEDIWLPATLGIDSRVDEEKIVSYWVRKAKAVDAPAPTV